MASATLRCFGGLALLLAWRVAAACDVTPHDRMTNFELVERTPNIVVAKVVDERPRGDGVEIELSVTQVVRGATVRVGDHAWIAAVAGSYFGPTTKGDFRTARPGARKINDCIVHDFRLGAHYLLFSARFTNTWHRLPHDAPYARIAEEIEPDNDPWPAAVMTYAGIAALPRREARDAAIDALIALGTNADADDTARAIASDLVAHRDTPTRYKRTEELIALYERLDPTQRDAVLPVLATMGAPAALPIFRAEIGHIFGPNGRVAALMVLCDYFSRVRDPNAIRLLLACFLMFDSSQLWWGEDVHASLLQLFAARADASHRTALEQLLRRVSDEDAIVLAAYFARFPSEFAAREIRRRAGSDFAARPRLAAALASLGERDVLAWATARVPSSDAIVRGHAIAIVASSPLPGADAIVAAIGPRGGDELEQLFAAFEHVRHPRALLRLEALHRFAYPPFHVTHARARRARAAWMNRLDPRELAALYLSLEKGDVERALRRQLLEYIVKLDASDVALMERLLARADDQDVGFRLAHWFFAVPSRFALADLARRVAGDYTKSLSLTYALAGMGDRDVLAWALEVLASPSTRRDRLLAVAVIGGSPHPEADARIAGVLATSGIDRTQLIAASGFARHRYADERLTAIAHQPNLSEEEQHWLETAHAERARRGIE